MIYMTTDEWKEISKLIEENDFYKLAEEIAGRTYDLDISKQELDEIIKKYKSSVAEYNEYKRRVISHTAYTLMDKVSEMHEAFRVNKPYFMCLPPIIHLSDRLEVAKEVFLVSHHNPDEYNFAFCDKDCQTIKITVKEDTKNTQATLITGAGDILELEGTGKQIEAFEAKRKEKNDALFPSCMSFIKTIELALEHGLTVKKVTTRKWDK